MNTVPSPETQRLHNLGIPYQYELHMAGTLILSKNNYPDVFDTTKDTYYQNEGVENGGGENVGGETETNYRGFKDIISVDSIKGHVISLVENQTQIYLVPCESMEDYYNIYNKTNLETLNKYGTYM